MNVSAGCLGSLALYTNAGVSPSAITAALVTLNTRIEEHCDLCEGFSSAAMSMAAASNSGQCHSRERRLVFEMAL
jgi:hypothetical protein